MLSKLFDHLFLPPGLFIILLILGIGFLLFKRARVFWTLFFTSLGLLYLCSIEPVRDAVLRPLENRYPPLLAAEAQEARYVVILGGGVVADSPEENRGSSPSRGAFKRLVYGLRVARRLQLPIILAGGSAYPEGNGPESEADAGMRILMELGFEESRILREDRSRNTWENARYVKELYEPETIILVTSAVHMPRSMLSFRKQKIAAIPAPTDYRVSRRPYTYRSYLPSAESLESIHSGMKEFVGIFYYMLRR